MSLVLILHESDLALLYYTKPIRRKYDGGLKNPEPNIETIFIFSSEKVLELCKMCKVLKCIRKISAQREYRDENVCLLKGDRALSKLITLLILNKKEFNHFFLIREGIRFMQNVTPPPPRFCQMSTF